MPWPTPPKNAASRAEHPKKRPRSGWKRGLHDLIERTLERNVVVQVVAFLRTRGLVGAAGGEARGIVVVATAAVAAAITSALAVAAAAQHGQLAVEALDDDLGRVLLDALLIGPFAGLQRAFDVYGRALLQIVFGHLDDVVVEDDHRVPLGLLLALARRLVAPGLRGGDTQVGDAVAVVQRADFRVATQVADQNDLVDAARHDRCPLFVLSSAP